MYYVQTGPGEGPRARALDTNTDTWPRRMVKGHGHEPWTHELQGGHGHGGGARPPGIFLAYNLQRPPRLLTRCRTAPRRRRTTQKTQFFFLSLKQSQFFSEFEAKAFGNLASLPNNLDFRVDFRAGAVDFRPWRRLFHRNKNAANEIANASDCGGDWRRCRRPCRH